MIFWFSGEATDGRKTSGTWRHLSSVISSFELSIIWVFFTCKFHKNQLAYPQAIVYKCIICLCIEGPFFLNNFHFRSDAYYFMWLYYFNLLVRYVFDSCPRSSLKFLQWNMRDFNEKLSIVSFNIGKSIPNFT